MNLRDFIKLCAVQKIKIYYMDGYTRNVNPAIIIERDNETWKWFSEDILNREIYLIATEEADTISVELKDFKEK